MIGLRLLLLALAVLPGRLRVLAPPAINEPDLRRVGPIAHLVHAVSFARSTRVAWTDKAMSGPIRYTVNTPWRIILHTTEGNGLPTYQGGAVAPQLTVDLKGRRTYRHYNYLTYAGKALKHPSGTPATNTTRAVQIEVIGYCDDRFASSPLHVSNWTVEDYAYLASVLRQVASDTGCSLTTSVTWKPYGRGIIPATSAGLHNGVRLSREAFLTVAGIIGHQHAPDNDHGDPGKPNLALLLAAPPAPKPVRRKGKLMMIGTVKNDNRSFYGDGITCRWIQLGIHRDVLVAAGAYVIPTEFDTYQGMYDTIGRRDPLTDPGTSKVSPPIPAGKTDPALYAYTPPSAA